MKKILIFIPVLWITFACKNEAKKAKTPTDSVVVEQKMAMRSADSLTLEDFRQLTDVQEQIEWLQTNGSMVYTQELNKYFIDNHLVEYTDPIKDGFKNAEKTSFTWATFQETFEGLMFEKFVKFNGSNRNLELTLVDTFDENDLNYCIPLFKAVQKKYNLTETSIIEVAKFRVSGRDVVAFSVKGESEVFDYTVKP